MRLEGANVLEVTRYEQNVCTKKLYCAFMSTRTYNHHDYNANVYQDQPCTEYRIDTIFEGLEAKVT